MHWSCPETERVARALRSCGKRVTAALIGLLLWSGGAYAGDSGAAMAEIEAFGQTLVMQTPFGSFEQKSASGADGMVSRTQLTPKIDDPLYGRHSVEIVTLRGGAQQGLSPSLIAATIQAQSMPFCRQAPQRLTLPVDIEGMAVLSSCAAQSHLGGDLATIQMVFFGPRDLHMAIWTELVRPPDSIVIDDPRWQQRVAGILPLHFCKPAADSPRMIQCQSPKQVKAARRQRAPAS
jgi:hypothetical protein